MKKLSPVGVYQSAYNFWNCAFKHHEEVTWDEFMVEYQKYMLSKGKYDFDEDQLRNLRNLIDPLLNMTISMREFVIFYEKHWNNLNDRRRIIKEFVPYPEVLNLQYHFYDLNLVVEKAPRRGLVKEGQTFKFTHLDLPSLIQDYKFDKTFGKEDCNYQIIDNDDFSYNNEAFRIAPFAKGFKVKCNERNRRLKFKVEEKPYSLIPGMVIQLGLNTQFKVLYANPLPTEKNSDYNMLFSFEKDKFAEFLVSEKVETTEEYNLKFNKFIKTYPNKFENEQRFVRLECISGPEKGHIFDFTDKIAYKQMKYSIGKLLSRNEVTLSDVTISNVHCTIEINEQYGWLIKEEEPSALGTYIMLPNYEQLKNGAASYTHEIHHGMKLSFDSYVFRCDLKRVDDKLENIYLKMQKTKSLEAKK